jgi:hypothetical protein
LNQQSRIGDLGMTQDDNTSDIIDIDPDQIIDNKVADEPILPAKPKRRYGVYGLGVAALALSAVAGAWLYRDVLATYLPSNQLHAMAARIDAVELANQQTAQKLNAVVGLTDEIKSQLGAAQSAAEDARKLATNLKANAGDSNAKLADLEKSLGLANAAVDELKGKVSSGTTTIVSGDSSGLTARVDKLEKDFTSLKDLSANAKVESSQLSQSYADIKAKIAAGSEYQTELKAIGAIVPAAEGLDVLTGDAANGVLTPQALGESLKNFAATAVKATEAPAEKDDSWWGKTTGLFSGLITIRNTGVVDWAQLALQGNDLIQNGQLVDAVKLLEQHLDSMPQALQDWRIAANKRIAADLALDQLGRAVARQIAARG